MKKCTVCDELLPLNDFYRDRCSKDGHECRECQHERVRTRKERAARGYSLAMEDRIPPQFTLRKEDDSPMPWVLRDAGEELGRFPVWPKKPCDLCIVMGDYIMDDIQDKPIRMKHFFYAQDPRVAQTRARRQRAAA